MRYGFGVDIWGDNTKFGFFDENGNLLDRWKIATPMDGGGNQILPSIADEIDDYMSRRGLVEDDIIGIGVGIPGPVNKDGTVGKCVNFGWGLFNLNRALSGLTGLRVCSGNIANLSAVGECWKGNGSMNTAFVAMNYGLGGAVVCNGNVVHGAHGGGGEIGHLIVNPKEKEACTCGRHGCAEQYCSPTGIVRLAKRQIEGSLQASTLRKRRGLGTFDYKDILTAAAQGDKVGKAVMDQVYDYAGQVVAHICCVTNPDTVLLGGEFGIIGQPALEGIVHAFHRYVFPSNENVKFLFAKLGTDACIYGAFKSVLDKYGDL